MIFRANVGIYSSTMEQGDDLEKLSSPAAVPRGPSKRCMNSARLTVWQPEKALPLEQSLGLCNGKSMANAMGNQSFSGIFNGLFFKFNGTS